MYHQFKSYLNFLIRASNQHGVHSPFVYNLVTNCLYDKKQYPAYATLKEHRKKLFADTSTISITDFGAGSRVFKSNKRPVNAIAKNAGISVKRQQLLFRLVTYFKPETILELGTSLGMGTIAMALGAPLVTINTVEGCKTTSAIANTYFDDFGIKNVTIKTEPFETFFQQTISEVFTFVYIDGNHSKEATLHNFSTLLKYAHNDSVFIFDDIYWSPEMTEAWQEIIAHPKVTVSIDTFQWGLVFFRKEQPKQHFSIRL
ncbi:O-methyltransferase [Rasiella sp. SM2506]|uniref:O-methyltransferase n=1 Tax=Rasiella sp. SM2506 TaxID=3423914 RepID=UPI003D7B73D2